MSYARMVEGSDIYLYSDGRQLNLHVEQLPRGFYTRSRGAMLAHVLALRDHGVLVPEKVIERLTREIQVEGDDVSV